MPTALETAIDRLSNGYWNLGSKTESNPGGLGADGHRDNWEPMLAAIGLVTGHVGTQGALADQVLAIQAQITAVVANGENIETVADNIAAVLAAAANMAAIIAAPTHATTATTQAGIATTKADEAAASAGTIARRYLTVAGTDTLTATAAPPLTSYDTGLVVRFVPVNTSAGPVTLNIDGLGAQALTDLEAGALGAGALVAGRAVEATYDGTRFRTRIIESQAVRLTGPQTIAGAKRGDIVPLTDGATITPDFDLGNNFSVTLEGNRTLANPTNITAGQTGIIRIVQDGTGSRTLAFGSYWKFAGGTAPDLTTTGGAVDVLAYYVETSTRITASLLADVS